MTDVSCVAKNLKTKTTCSGGARSGKLFVVKNKHQAVMIAWCGHRAPRGVVSSLRTPEAVAWADAGTGAQTLFISGNTLPENVPADARVEGET